jgi:sulfatase modifying factor 1
MSCEDCPMTQVDSNDSKKVIEKLKAKGITAILPTEAQQEYYMRGSYGGRKEITESTYPWDGAEKQIDDHAWYINNAGRQGKKIQPVGSTKIPSNSYGIKDPLGNVLEWSMTAYSEYKNAPTVENAISDSEDPETSDGLIRVIRGCGWSNLAQHCRPAQRTKFNPDYSSDYLGLRFVVEP